MREGKFTIIWRGISLATSWIVRAALALFSIVLMVLGIAVFTAAILGRTPTWLPNSRLIDPTLVDALSSLLLGFAGLYIGTRLRKYQEMEAEARAKLALNVDLRTRVVPAGDRRILEIIIDVHNVSRTTWFVPMAYLFVRSAFHGDDEVSLGREFNNIAKYSASLCQLQPDEKEQFFATVIFGPEERNELAAVVVTAEVVGTAGKWLGPRTAMMNFIDFMGQDNGVRHKYLCIDRCATKRDKLYGRRCFLKPDLSVDQGPTVDYRGLLDDIMLWTRERVVALIGHNSELGEGGSEFASYTSFAKEGREGAGAEVT